MSGDDEKKSQPSNEPLPLVDELGVEDLSEPIFGGRGRLFSAAGREAPVAEFTEDFLVLHPPQKPFEEDEGGRSEVIDIKVDARGVLLDTFGAEKRISGAKYQGYSLYFMGQQQKGTTRHLVGWFDDHGESHFLYVHGEPITTDIAYRLRNKTHDGEISIFPDLRSDPNSFEPPPQQEPQVSDDNR